MITAYSLMPVSNNFSRIAPRAGASQSSQSGIDLNSSDKRELHFGKGLRIPTNPRWGALALVLTAGLLVTSAVAQRVSANNITAAHSVVTRVQDESPQKRLRFLLGNYAFQNGISSGDNSVDSIVILLGSLPTKEDRASFLLDMITRTPRNDVDTLDAIQGLLGRIDPPEGDAGDLAKALRDLAQLQIKVNQVFLANGTSEADNSILQKYADALGALRDRLRA